MTFSTTNATVNATANISGSLPSPSASQTIVTKFLSSAATDATIHTVTAGKTFYCTGVNYGISAGGSAGIKVNGTQVLNSICAANTNATLTGGVLFTCPASQVIATYCNAGSWFGCIWGYEA